MKHKGRRYRFVEGESPKNKIQQAIFIVMLLIIAAGIVSMYLFHILENAGMTMGLMPVTGIPLPFVSYGGSSMLTNLAGIALLQNIYVHRQRLIF